VIEISLNGEPRRVNAGATVSALLADIGILPRKVAVERNLEIVPKSKFDDTQLDQGDQIEIVQFVGGG